MITKVTIERVSLPCKPLTELTILEDNNGILGYGCKSGSHNNHQNISNGILKTSQKVDHIRPIRSTIITLIF